MSKVIKGGTVCTADRAWKADIPIPLQNSHVLRQEQICVMQYALADHKNLLMLKKP